MKKHKAGIYLVLFLLLTGGITALYILFNNNPIPVQATISEIHPTELTNSVTVKGTVESVKKDLVYTYLNFRTEKVSVHKGDNVEEGQVLCVLDTEDLDLSIEQLKTQLDISQKSGLNQYDNSKRLYDEAIKGDPQVAAAKLAMESAQNNYDKALNDFNNNTDPNVNAAESALSGAALDLQAKETSYSKNKVLFDGGVISEQEYNQYLNLYNDAKNRFDDAQTTLDNAKNAQASALKQLEIALKTAKANYNSAVTLQDRAAEQAKSALDAAEIALNKDSLLIDIKKLEKQQADAVIKSPAPGTITAVYAKEGAVAAGLLFVVEDTHNLKITSAIKEYDYSKVRQGMDVIIKSDMTGDEEYGGVISSIDLAALKNAVGDTLSASDVEFGITVDITSPDTPLRIGMNVNLAIVLEKKTDIFCVRYDAVIENEKGGNIIFSAVKSDAGAYTLKQMPVEIGMSNDFYIEISGAGLKDGLNVLNDASAVADELKKLNKSLNEVGSVKFKLN